jgi:hypothetical protein
MNITDEEVENFLKETFERNFELLKLESGHSLDAKIKDMALRQVLYYWKKLKNVAEQVTETEVHLNLPLQESPEGRQFGIEGVVDIVQDNEKTVMYDIKTHEAEQVRANLIDYEDQLNIYAHIWKNLHCQPLDETAIIATAFPESLQDALEGDDSERLEYELAKWDPLVEIEIDSSHIDRIIHQFGEVVDCIEGGEFEPASLEKLKSQHGKQKITFATNVCRNCDARYSCASYRYYAQEGSSHPDLALRQYLNDYGSDHDQQDWLSSNLETALNALNLD